MWKKTAKKAFYINKLFHLECCIEIRSKYRVTGLDLLQSSGKYPCAVCCTGVSNNNSIYCNGCQLWVHKKCSWLHGLTQNPDYRCARCIENACPVDGRPQSEVQVGPDKLEEVASFCYLGDMLFADGGCEITVTTRVKTAWKKLREFSHPATSLTRPMGHDQTDLQYQVKVCGQGKVK